MKGKKANVPLQMIRQALRDANVPSTSADYRENSSSARHVERQGDDEQTDGRIKFLVLTATHGDLYSYM